MRKEITIKELADEYPFEPHWLRVGSMKIHYLDEGKGPVLLLLHACPMWSFSFRRVIRDLCGEYRIIAPDFIGFGMSDKPHDYDYRIDTQVRMTEQLLAGLGITKFSIVMHGWGATIGTNYIVHHPEQVENIVIMNSMAFSGYALPWRLRFYRAWPWLAERFLIDLDFIFSGIRHLPEIVQKGYRFPFQKHNDKVAILRFIAQMPCVPEDESFESMIEVEHGLWLLREHPICFIWAAKDWLYSKKCLQSWMRFCPDSKIYRIANAGRYVMDEAYEEFFDALSSFLRSHKK